MVSRIHLMLGAHQALFGKSAARAFPRDAEVFLLEMSNRHQVVLLKQIFSHRDMRLSTGRMHEKSLIFRSSVAIC